MEDIVLAMRNIVKVYPNGLVANKGINLFVRRGEIHALCGENGAGKSTLMKILFGEERCEEGEIQIFGKTVSIQNPAQAIQLGIGMVHQHFMLASSMTVAENIVMGIEPTRFGFVQSRKMKKMAREIIEKYKFDIDINATVGTLPVGQKQKVEILKALLRGAKILILDEPTAVLTPQETAELFVQLTRLKNTGHTVIFISHKLNEVKQICDQITILRDGRNIGGGFVSEMTMQQISRMMVGRDVVEKIVKKAMPETRDLLEIKNLYVNDAQGRLKIKNINICLKAGEILGIAGIEGNGQRELAEVISGLNPYYQGDILIENKSLRGQSVHQIRLRGVAHIPEDRMTYGVAREASITENILALRYGTIELQRWGIVRHKQERRLAKELIDKYMVICGGQDQKIVSLSGGNIQKIVVARECSSRPDLIIANQPTRGIDVGASEFVRKALLELRDSGAGVLLISADLNEVIELSDRLLVVCEGEVVAEFPNANQVNEEELGEYMLGLKRMGMVRTNES